MTYLADKQVLELVKSKDLIIDPYFQTFQGPNLYYCHLGNRFLFPKANLSSAVDPLAISSKDIYDEVVTNDPIVIKSGSFLLAETFEYFGISEEYVIRLFNSSSLARVGVSHAAIGMINPGCGSDKPVKLTLELINNFPADVVLTPTVAQPDRTITWGTEVLKIAIARMDTKPSVSYNEWKHAVYHVDQKVSGPKMKGRFNDEELILPENSLHNK